MSSEPSLGEDAVSFDSVLADAKPVVKRAKICLRGDLVAELERLEIELAEARLFDETTNDPDTAPAIAEQIVALTDEARRYERTFLFQSIGRRAWRDLVAEHPPTEAERKEGRDFNGETFPAVAMAACCVAPTGATLEKFEQLRDSPSLGDTQWNRLWVACLQANTRGADIPLSEAAFGMVRGTDSNSE